MNSHKVQFNLSIKVNHLLIKNSLYQVFLHGFIRSGFHFSISSNLVEFNRIDFIYCGFDFTLF